MLALDWAGKGTFGKVWLAVDRLTNANVAIKRQEFRTYPLMPLTFSQSPSDDLWRPHDNTDYEEITLARDGFFKSLNAWARGKSYRARPKLGVFVLLEDNLRGRQRQAKATLKQT